MSEIKVRQIIPEAWAERGQCPFCAATGMRLQHPATGADQLQCTACGLAFELEMEGAHLHVCHWPNSLPFLHLMAPDAWLTPTSLRTIIQQLTAPSATPASPSPTTPPIPIPLAQAKTSPGTQISGGDATPAASPSKNSSLPVLDTTGIILRIKKLQALGNTPKEIQTILTQTEMDPDRIQRIIGITDQMERQERARQAKKLRRSFGILGVVVLILVAAGFILQKMYQSEGPAAAGAQLQATQAPNLVVKILNLSTPVVHYGGYPPGGSTSSAANCPQTSQEAANLFGGFPTDWNSPPDSNGWFMIRKGTPAVVFIPNGMKAAYLQLGNRLQLVEVSGPATLSGVYYIALSCP